MKPAYLHCQLIYLYHSRSRHHTLVASTPPANAPPMSSLQSLCVYSRERDTLQSMDPSCGWKQHGVAHWVVVATTRNREVTSAPRERERETGRGNHNACELNQHSTSQGGGYAKQGHAPSCEEYILVRCGNGIGMRFWKGKKVAHSYTHTHTHSGRKSERERNKPSAYARSCKETEPVISAKSNCRE